MRESFAKRPLARRVVALLAAYAVALSGLTASFGAVRAAIAGTISSGVVICHVTVHGQRIPTGDSSGDCDNSCCIGCVLVLAAVAPPPTNSVAMERMQGLLLPTPAAVEPPFAPQDRSHQSRGPPRKA